MNNLLNSCRACLITSESFSYFLHKDISPEMYLFCTSIEVKQDGLPNSLCNRCFSLLTQFIEFKKTCIKSDNVLRYGLSKNFKTKAESENCMDSTKEESNTNVKELEDIVKTEAFIDIGASESDFHDDTGAYYDDLKAKLIGVIRKPKEPNKIVAKTISQLNQLRNRFNFSCKLCNKKFGFRERFDAHILEHEGITTSIHCAPCNKTFTTWGGLKRHNDSEHARLSIAQLTCHLCPKIFKSLRTLKLHQATHGDRKQRICDVCGKRFKSNLTLKAHLETHIENRERRYPCQHCGKRYLSKKTRASHTSRRHTNKRYICHHCDYPFTDKSNLAKHILIHEGKQQLHKCDLCLKAYSSQSALVVHKRIHTGEKPYGCSYCPKRFSNRRMLVDHQRIHTGEKPHKCTVCEQSFTQRGTMKRHMKVHDEFVRNGKVCHAAKNNV